MAEIEKEPQYKMNKKLSDGNSYFVLDNIGLKEIQLGLKISEVNPRPVALSDCFYYDVLLPCGVTQRADLIGCGVFWVAKPDTMEMVNITPIDYDYMD